MVRGEEVDLEQATRLVNAQTRALTALYRRRAKPTGVAAYLAAKAAAK
jgi:hypothetical protein